MTELPARLGIEKEGLWGFLEELAEATAIAASHLGIAPSRVSNATEEAQVDTLLAIGSVNLYSDLVRRPRSARRVLWHVEPLPQAARGRADKLHETLPTGRLLDIGRSLLPRVGRTAAWRRAREQAANVREPVNNLAKLRRDGGVFDRIVIDTLARAEGAVATGIPYDVVPFGYHPAYAGPLADAAAPRDIAVLTLANISKLARRHRLVTGIAADLRGSSIDLVQVPDHTYGADRRAVLERARVVIDIHRLPGSHPLFRFILSAAAGAAMISEPLSVPDPLVPGVHYIEVATTDLADATRELLADEPRRRRIVAAAQALLRTELDLNRTLPLALG